jgi:hypothetical protein
VARPNRLSFKLLVLVVSCTLSIAFVDVAFRVYERAFLIHDVPAGAQSYMLERMGFNDHEGFLEEQRRPGSFRILSFGDSFAQAVTIGSLSYAARLQDRLEALSRRPVRVVNFGRGGTSFPDYHLQMQRWSDRVAFDGVLLNIYAGNDFLEQSSMLHVTGVEDDRGPDETDGLRYGPGLSIPRRFPLRFVDYIFAHYFSRYYATDATERDERYYADALQYSPYTYMRAQSPIVRVYQPEFLESLGDSHFWLYKLLLAARELELQGKQVALTLAPSHFAADRAWREEVLAEVGVEASALDLDLPARVVRGLASAASFAGPILYLTPCLREASDRGQEMYWGTNTHWNVEGNQRVADVLAPVLAARWLDVEEPGRDPAAGACSTQMPEPNGLVSDYLTKAIEGFDSLLAFEQSTIAGLLQNDFADLASLFAALEGAGFEHAPQQIRGAFWGFRPVPNRKARFAQRHGIRHVKIPIGWAQDAQARGEVMMVAFYRDGQLLGVGRTTHAAEDRARFVPGIRATTPNVIFEGLIAKPRPRLQRVEELWVVAISTRGTFARLHYVPGPADLVVPGGRRAASKAVLPTKPRKNRPPSVKP